MKSFDELSKVGKIRRLRHLALAALQHYPLAVKSLRCISTRWSTIFRVEVTDGQRYALRINAPGVRTPTMIFSEMIWQEALAQDGRVPVAAPIRTKRGDLLVTASVEGIPQARHIIITRWLDGRLITQFPSPDVMRLLGATMAKLHNHAQGFIPPEGFTSTRLDSPWVWGAPTYLQDDNTLLKPQQKAIFSQATTQVLSWLDGLYGQPHCLLFIHADLHLKNVALKDQSLQLFDFGDSIWGHPLQDLAVPLYWVETALKADQTLRDALLTGYQQHRSLPYSERDLQQAVLFRAVTANNYVLNVRLKDYPTAPQQATHFYQRWLNAMR